MSIPISCQSIPRKCCLCLEFVGNNEFPIQMLMLDNLDAVFRIPLNVAISRSGVAGSKQRFHFKKQKEQL